MRTTTKQINWATSKADSLLITQIAKRAVQIAQASNPGTDYDMCHAQMDIRATHANGCPLDLNKLLNAPPFDFSHDVFGIYRHLNRETGELMNFFVPRCAMPRH